MDKRLWQLGQLQGATCMRLTPAPLPKTSQATGGAPSAEGAVADGAPLPCLAVPVSKRKCRTKTTGDPYKDPTYDPHNLRLMEGASWADMKHLLALHPVWDTKAVDDLTYYGLIPPLLSAKGRRETAGNPMTMCTFKAPNGDMVDLEMPIGYVRKFWPGVYDGP
jgi:hypothetical protein